MTDSYATSNPSASAGGTRTKGIVSLVLGIVSLLAAIIPLLGAAGIAAVIMGILSRRSEPTAKNFALAGIILGIVGFVLGIIFFVLGIIAAAELLQQQGL